MTTDISHHAAISLSSFRSEGGGSEYHAVIRPSAKGGAASQLQAISAAFVDLKKYLGEGVKEIFGRYFLSDPANQADLTDDVLDCAVSVVGQPVLGSDLPKAVLWVYLREGAVVSAGADGLTEVHLPCGVTELWQGSQTRSALDSYEATRAMLRSYASVLRARGGSLADNCQRTWFFVRDVDVNYRGVVHGRNEVFADEGLVPRTHFIASTGIGGLSSDQSVTVSFDSYSVFGLGDGAVRYLNGASHLNPTYEYGVAFERGVCIDFPDRRHVLISGTASIDNKGEILYPGDIERQTGRMCENVEVLLAEAGCAPAAILQAIVYVRDTADALTVEHMIAERYPGVPFVVVLAPVCRPGWLVEMECMASVDLSAN